MKKREIKLPQSINKHKILASFKTDDGQLFEFIKGVGSPISVIYMMNNKYSKKEYKWNLTK